MPDRPRQKTPAPAAPCQADRPEPATALSGRRRKNAAQLRVTIGVGASSQGPLGPRGPARIPDRRLRRQSCACPAHARVGAGRVVADFLGAGAGRGHAPAAHGRRVLQRQPAQDTQRRLVCAGAGRAPLHRHDDLASGPQAGAPANAARHTNAGRLPGQALAEPAARGCGDGRVPARPTPARRHPCCGWDCGALAPCTSATPSFAYGRWTYRLSIRPVAHAGSN